MSKIKFNKEWYHDSRIAINFRTEEEADKFIIELEKVGITNWFDGRPLLGFNKFSLYGGETCYNYDSSTTLYCASKSDYLSVDYTILKFSDLEFEDEYELNEDDLGYEEFDNSFNKLHDVMSNSILKKSEPIIGTDAPTKRTILRESVELKNGDIFEIIYSNVKSIGIVIDDYVLYNDGTWDSLDITNNITWIIYGEDIKSMSIGHEISQLLFKNKLEDNLEDFITYVQDKPEESIKKTVEVFTVRFCKTESGMSHYISDSEEIFVEDIVSPIRGEYEDLYGEVINIQYKELSEEELKSYNKMIKIK